MKIVWIAVAASALVGCATGVEHPKSIQPAMISPSEYANYSCDQLKTTQVAAWKRKEDVRIPLKSAAEDFRFLALTHEYSEQKHEFSDLLGRLQIIQMVAFKKDCTIDTVEDLKRAYSLDGVERPRWPSPNPQVGAP